MTADGDRRQVPQPEAQLWMTSPQTVTEKPHGMVVQSGSTHATQVPAALQDDPAAQFPHATLLPQPSGAVPQVLPWQGFGFGAQHALVWHLSADGQVFGHVMVPPQPSGTLPHATPMHA